MCLFDFRISPENSWVSSNFKGEFSRSLKEMFHKEMWMQDLLDIKLAAAAGNYENPFHNFLPIYNC